MLDYNNVTHFWVKFHNFSSWDELFENANITFWLREPSDRLLTAVIEESKKSENPGKSQYYLQILDNELNLKNHLDSKTNYCRYDDLPEEEQFQFNRTTS